MVRALQITIFDLNHNHTLDLDDRIMRVYRDVNGRVLPAAEVIEPRASTVRDYILSQVGEDAYISPHDKLETLHTEADIAIRGNVPISQELSDFVKVRNSVWRATPYGQTPFDFQVYLKFKHDVGEAALYYFRLRVSPLMSSLFDAVFPFR